VAELGSLIDSVLKKNPKQVEQFKAGKGKLMGFFVGQIMKETQGRANPKRVNELLQTKLS
jgi:aspartyl-tRNA(Asn)/glutamyl-tRNA(Gln) amidotransferase subunit B